MTTGMHRYMAEFIGTAALIIVGCGAVAIGGYDATQGAGAVGIALAFGFTVAALAYAIGPISGCHINPAVTLAFWAAGRTDRSEVAGYIVAQTLGAIVGAGVLVVLLSGKSAGYDLTLSGLGQNGWGDGYLGEFSLFSAFLMEVIATFLFLIVILGATAEKGTTPVAGLAIGFALVVLIVTFLPVTGVSVNPARSIGPAVFVGGKAIAQLWLFLVAPVVGAVLAGLLAKARLAA